MTLGRPQDSVRSSENRKPVTDKGQSSKNSLTYHPHKNLIFQEELAHIVRITCAISCLIVVFNPLILVGISFAVLLYHAFLDVVQLLGGYTP